MNLTKSDLNLSRIDELTGTKAIMQTKTIKSKNNGCGTALGNLVIIS